MVNRVAPFIIELAWKVRQLDSYEPAYSDPSGRVYKFKIIHSNLIPLPTYLVTSSAEITTFYPDIVDKPHTQNLSGHLIAMYFWNLLC